MRLFGRRAYPRELIYLEAQLIAGQGSQPAMLHDLSVKGAKLSLAQPPRSGTEVMVRWACFAAVGRVAWVEGGTCGLEFERQLDKRVVATTQAASAQGLPPERQSA